MVQAKARCLLSIHSVAGTCGRNASVAALFFSARCCWLRVPVRRLCLSRGRPISDGHQGHGAVRGARSASCLAVVEERTDCCPASAAPRRALCSRATPPALVPPRQRAGPPPPAALRPCVGQPARGRPARAESRPPDARLPRHPVGVRPARVGPPASRRTASSRCICSVTQGCQLSLCLGGALDRLRRAAPRPRVGRPAREARPPACGQLGLDLRRAARLALLCSLSQGCQVSLCLGGAPDRLLALRLSVAPGGLLA